MIIAEEMGLMQRTATLQRQDLSGISTHQDKCKKPLEHFHDRSRKCCRGHVCPEPLVKDDNLVTMFKTHCNISCTYFFFVVVAGIKNKYAIV